MTAHTTRLFLAALEGEARRSGCTFTWTLDPYDSDKLNPDIFPRGHSYYDMQLTVTARNYHHGRGEICNESELASVPDKARDLIQAFITHRRATEDSRQATFSLFSDPPAEDEDTEEPEPENEEDTPDPWELDRTPEENGLTCFDICTAYIYYLFYGDDTGDMTDEEIKLCDDFSRKWRAVDTAKCHNGEPWTDEFNRRPDLSLHGYACQTEGVWCEPITPTTPAA